MAFYEALPSLPNINTYAYPIAPQPYESPSESYSESSSPDTYVSKPGFSYELLWRHRTALTVLQHMRQSVSPSEPSPYVISYGSPQIPFYPAQEKIPLEYIDSTSLDNGDQRERRSTQKGPVTSMHLVSRNTYTCYIYTHFTNIRHSDVEHKTVLLNGHSENERRNMSRALKASYRPFMSSTRVFFSHTIPRPTKSKA